jgi:cytochrome c peroxidase
MPYLTRIVVAALALLALSSDHPLDAATAEVQVREVAVGLNGDARVQFLVLEQLGGGQNLWGPQPGETQARALLQFFDAAGRETGVFAFPENPGTGGSLLTLVATAEFARLPGMPMPDVIIPPLLVAGAGSVCFSTNPLGAAPEARRDCVTYTLPITDAVSVRRSGTVDGAATFVRTAAPTPVNLAGQRATLQASSLVSQGEALFHRETFQGNGRTCATCHAPEHSLGLQPSAVTRRFQTVGGTYDSLFIAEQAPSAFDDGFDYGLNRLVLEAPVRADAPCTGDLRGLVQATSGGRAKVIARLSPTVYLVGGGLAPRLSGVVTDGVCAASVLSVVAGDLGAVPNASVAGLEDPRRLRTSALFLENVDGFQNPAVFRKSPHLLNMRFTAPFGFSGDVSDLRTFSGNAITQHFPRTLARSHSSATPDFRLPTTAELAALEAFMLAQEFPAGPDPAKFNLDRFVVTAAQRRGRDAFFGNQAKCSRCHGGPVLATTTVSVQGKPVGVNAAFDTGIARREISVPQLFNVVNLAPLFHDGSAATVREAVDFYDGPVFNNSPAGRAIGGINIPGNVRRDITAFLEALVAGDRAPSIQSDPANQTVTAGGTAVFEVEAVGVPTPSFVWQVSNDGGTTWEAVTNGGGVRGAATPALVIAPVDGTWHNARFRVVVSNVVGTVTSASAALTVRIPTPPPPAVPVSPEPFGQVDTPRQNAEGVTGAVAITGWVLDDVGVEAVRIYRTCLPSDDSAACQTVAGIRAVYISDAAFLEGARPDIAAIYPDWPNAARAGWGALVLTNMLRDGVTTFHVAATDRDGRLTWLGRSITDHTPTTITLANETIARPFGAIDVPVPGATVSGMVNVFGWALTPDTNTLQGDADVVVPVDGRTMVVFIDGQPLSTVAFNQCRGSVGNPVPAGVYCDDDVASAFGVGLPQPVFTPRVANTTRFRNLDAGQGAIGSFTFDSRSLADGTHTLAWSVTDSAGRTEGIGSRFFRVQNPTAPASRTTAPPSDTFSIVGHPLTGRQGFAVNTPWQRLDTDEAGVAQVRIPVSSRVEIDLGEVTGGYLRTASGLSALPPGAVVSGRMFTWMPAPGFLGTFQFTFPTTDPGGAVRVDVTIAAPDSRERLHLYVDSPAGAATVSPSLRVAGWAFDEGALSGPGIAAVHVWATRVDVPAQSPTFLGEATLGQSRPDVALVHGVRAAGSGYVLDTVLDPGVYDVTVFAWMARTARWEDARTVRVTVGPHAIDR